MNRLLQLIETSETRPVLGASVYTYNPAFVEMAGIAGFKIIWIEMEHAHLSFSEVSDLCRIAAGVDMLTMIRVPNSSRESVLKAAECGPDIIDLPMGNYPEKLMELVRHARYAPEGSRGFFWASRAVRYGMGGNIVSEQKKINSELCLLSQIESVEAVDRVEELCAVEGIDGIFIGPGDLSCSFGNAGDIEHPSIQSAIANVIRTAKSMGKIVAVAGSPAEALKYGELGVDVLFCCGDISCMRIGLKNTIAEACPLIVKTSVSTPAFLGDDRII